MILGNSFRNNKGKRYFVRRRDKDDADYLYAGMADDFNRWFDQNHRSMVLQLRDKHAFDADIFNETYLKIYDIILFSGLKIKRYMSYFMRSYFTNTVNAAIKERRYCGLHPVCETLGADDASQQEELGHLQKKLETDILNFVYANYDLREFELFKMYISLKPAVNYSSLAAITHIKAHVIQHIVSKIKKDLQDNTEFARRWQEVS